MTRKTIPEFFCTTVRKVEPVGGDCIRIYHSVERAGVWDDIFTVLIPIASVLVNARFVMDAATDIFNESRAERAIPSSKERVH
jgi:hypothetical protein